MGAADRGGRRHRRGAARPGRQPRPSRHPVGDPEGVARTIASSRIWVPGHLAIVVGLVLMLGGLLAIGRSIQGGLPGALARLGAAAAVAGITVGEPTTLSRS